MRSLNKVQLIGHVGCTPKTYAFPDGKLVVNFTLATEHYGQSAKNQLDLQPSTTAIPKEQKKREKEEQEKQAGQIDQEKQEDQKEKNSSREVDWHHITCYGKLAEIAAQYVRMGHRVYVEGYLRHRSFEDKNTQKRFVTEVVVREFILLTNRGVSTVDHSVT